MNQTFSFHRFRLVFIKTVLERPAQIIGSFILSFSVALLIYFFFKSMGNYELAQLFSFTVGLIGGGCLLASFVLGYFSDNAISASYLTLPASTFEKWLCGIILVGILYFLGFLLFFRGMDTMFVNIYHHGLNHLDPRYQRQYDSVYLFSFPDAQDLIVFFLNAAGAMLVGSLYFNKLGFIKVALLICGLYFFTFLFNYLFNSILFKDLANAYPFHFVNIKKGEEHGVVQLPLAWDEFFDIACRYILPAILLIVSYIRLREKEA